MDAEQSRSGARLAGDQLSGGGLRATRPQLSRRQSAARHRRQRRVVHVRRRPVARPSCRYRHRPAGQHHCRRRRAAAGGPLRVHRGKRSAELGRRASAARPSHRTVGYGVRALHLRHHRTVQGRAVVLHPPLRPCDGDDRHPPGRLPPGPRAPVAHRRGRGDLYQPVQGRFDRPGGVVQDRPVLGSHPALQGGRDLAAGRHGALPAQAAAVASGPHSRPARRHRGAHRRERHRVRQAVRRGGLRHLQHDRDVDPDVLRPGPGPRRPVRQAARGRTGQDRRRERSAGRGRRQRRARRTLRRALDHDARLSQQSRRHR